MNETQFEAACDEEISLLKRDYLKTEVRYAIIAALMLSKLPC